MSISYKQRKKMKDVHVELGNEDNFVWISNYKGEGPTIIVNLVFEKTGEIRQKRLNLDQLARKVFASEMKTWKDKGPYFEIELEEMK